MASQIEGPSMRPFRRLLPLALSALLLSGCVGGGGDGGNDDSSKDGDGGGGGSDSEGAASPDEVAASSLSTSLASGSDLQFDIYPIRRLDNDVALLNFSVTNKGEDTARIYGDLSGREKATTAEGVTIIDTVNAQRYMPLKLTDDSCHCSDFDGQQNIPSGESVDIWVAYPAPPDDVESVTVATLATPDFVDIPVVDGSGEEEEISEATTSEPEIRDITSFQMDTEGTREDSGDESKIMLSSDVLFELNESDLTSEADSALKEVAEEIDNSSASEVKIDGYTDNSGNDSINNPLSKERAESVQERLEDLVSKDVTFTSEGHGSSDPIGDNETEEGREQNRRVTISFAK